MNKNRLGSPTALDRIDALIDWYEAYKPDAGQVIRVSVSPKELAKMLARLAPVENGQVQPFPKQQPYRGRMLEAVK